MTWSRDIPAKSGWYWVTQHPDFEHGYREVWFLDWSDLWCCVSQDHPRSAKYMRDHGYWFGAQLQPPTTPEAPR